MNKGGADAEQIRDRAYQLWHQDGCPEGGALDYWLRAEAELAAEGPPDPAGSVRRAADEPAPQPRPARPRSSTPRSAARTVGAKPAPSEAEVKERTDGVARQRRARAKAEG